MLVTAVEVRRSRGTLVVVGLGATPRGQRYIKAQKELKAKRVSDKDFKAQMTAAVDEMLARGELGLP